MPVLELLILLLAANGAPVLANRLLGETGNQPIDAGIQLRDGRPLLGRSKTWRGLVAALLVAPAFALLLGYDAVTGLLIGIGAMLGDLLSSFIKRRLAIPPSGMALGLDQIPEALLPLLAVRWRLHLTWEEIALITLAFLLTSLVLSRILYELNIRRRPY